MRRAGRAPMRAAWGGLPMVAGLLLALSVGPSLVVGAAATEDLAGACGGDSVRALAALAPGDGAPVGAVCAFRSPARAVEAMAAAFPVADRALDLHPGELPALQLVVALRDTATGEIGARYLQRLEQDAAFELGTRSLQLDMGDYRLAPDRLAFGLVIDNAARGPSCPEGGANRELTLFLVEDSGLRPVLREYLDAWGMIRGDACRGWRSAGVVVRDSVERRFKVAPTRSHGLADLQLIEVHRRATWSAAADEPVWKTVETRRLVRYDGHRYVVTPGDDPFAADASAADAPLTEARQP